MQCRQIAGSYEARFEGFKIIAMALKTGTLSKNKLTVYYCQGAANACEHDDSTEVEQYMNAHSFRQLHSQQTPTVLSKAK